MNQPERNCLIELYSRGDDPGEPLNESLASAYRRLSKDDQKKLRESLVYVHFARSASLNTVALAHQNENPPLPDISADVDGERCFFELAEITEQQLAVSVNDSIQGENPSVVFTDPEGPVMSIAAEKCRKSYPTNGAKMDLILYYGVNQPAPRRPSFLTRHSDALKSLLDISDFEKMWVFSDQHPRCVLWVARRRVN